MNPRLKCTAIKSLLLVALLGSAAWVQAAPVAGIVTHLSGPLFVNKADGSMRILSVQSTVEAGDTVSTQGKVYAQIRFSDDSQLTLQPDTVVTLNTYVYDAAMPAQDQLRLTLQQGGLRSDVGKLGQRSLDRVTLVTPAASIALQSASIVVQYSAQPQAVAGIAGVSRYLALTGAEFEAAAIHSDSAYGAFTAAIAARYSYRLARVAAWLDSTLAGSLATVAAASAPPLSLGLDLPSGPTALSPPGVRPSGLYVQVIDGMINVTNPTGSLSFSAGGFGYTANLMTPTVPLPVSQTTLIAPPAPMWSALPSPKGQASSVECEVR